MHPYLDHPGPIAFAHRGGAGVFPENTMAAFAHAIGLGFRYLETDVHSTRDGVLMAFHDENLLRTCGVDSNINEMTSGEIAGLKVYGTEHVPTFEEILETWPEARINVDCKDDSAVESLDSILRRKAVIDRVCVGAFSDRRLRHFRAQFGANLCTSMGPREIAQARLASLVSRVPFTSEARAAQVPLRQGPIGLVDRKFVDFCHSKSIHVHVWTVDDPDLMHQLLDLGVDGLMTDEPAVLRDVLKERGTW